MKVVTAFLFSFCLFLSPATFSEDAYYEHKDWLWSSADTFNFAITTNSKDELFGQFCYLDDQACYYMLNMRLDCEPGEIYPAMISAKSGTRKTNLVCSDFGEEPTFMLQPFDEIDNLVRTESKFGLVVGLESGQFKVSRFSLKGSTRMVSEMRAMTLKQIRNDSKARPKKKSKLPDGEYL